MPINTDMSNEYPEPPKLSSAKNLMNRPVQPKPAVESPTPADDEQTAPRSVFPQVPTLPEAQEKPAEVVAEETPVETVIAEDSQAEANPVIDSTETSETDVALGQVEAPETSEEGEEEETPEKRKPVEDVYGGPWGIIKHTGYVPVALWAVLTGAVTGVTGYFFAPSNGSPATWITLAVLGFMTGMIAAIDRKTHLIKNQHTILTAILTAPLAIWAGFMLGGWNILFGLLAAVVVFGVFIFLVIKANFGSGGDIKFSPVPAFALGVVSPLISALWLFYALIVTVILLVVRGQKSTSFGEGMAISLPFAIFSVYAMYAMTGLAYMHPAAL